MTIFYLLRIIHLVVLARWFSPLNIICGDITHLWYIFARRLLLQFHYLWSLDHQSLNSNSISLITQHSVCFRMPGGRREPESRRPRPSAESRQSAGLPGTMSRVGGRGGAVLRGHDVLRAGRRAPGPVLHQAGGGRQDIPSLLPEGPCRV